MTITKFLEDSFKGDVLFIGQLGVQRKGDLFIIAHLNNWEDVEKQALEHLKPYRNVDDAREIVLYNSDGEYRFTKGQLDLIDGWYLQVSGIRELRKALDIFYPAALGLNKAHKDESLNIQNLREKLNRQTGMYRYARTVSDEGAQELVTSLCGPGNNCVKKILWNIDEGIPLNDSEASRFDGVVAKEKDKAIPLICQEACNFFVSKCRIKAKKEFEAKAVE